MYTLKKNILFLALVLIMNSVYSQSVAWERAGSLGRGINLSWLENWWLGTGANDYMDYLDLSTVPGRKADMQLISELGFKTVRLPVTFDKWAEKQEPYAIIKTEYFQAIDSILAWAELYNLIVIIDNHHGVLNTNNVITETNRIKAIWRQVTERYGDRDPDKVLFEIYNEPYDIYAYLWESAATAIVQAIRELDTDQTIIVGGIDYNSIGGLEDLNPLDDNNIIYTFHFYDPFLFTHQGAEWVGDPVMTINIPYPYDEQSMPTLSGRVQGTWGESLYNNYRNDGTKAALRATIKQAADWSAGHNLPVFCGEWGSYQVADLNSRCRHTKDLLDLFDEFDIPNTMWEWDQGFSFFNGEPGIENIYQCMAEAFGFFNTGMNETSRPGNGSLKICPNPARVDQPVFSVGFNCEHGEIMNYALRDMRGMLVSKGYVTTQPGFNIIDIPARGQAGLYILSIAGEKDVLRGKVMIR